MQSGVDTSCYTVKSTSSLSLYLQVKVIILVFDLPVLFEKYVTHSNIG